MPSDSSHLGQTAQGYLAQIAQKNAHTYWKWKPNYLKFSPIDLPLGSFHFKSGPFMLYEMKCSRDGVLNTLFTVLVWFICYTIHTTRRSQLSVYVLRWRIFFHIWAPKLIWYLHDMAAITDHYIQGCAKYNSRTNTNPLFEHNLN